MQQAQTTGVWDLILDEIDAAVLIVGRDDVIRYINSHVLKDLGKPREQIVGVSCRQVFWPEFLSVYDNIVAECEKNREFTCIYYWAEMTLWEQISARSVIWEGKPSILLTITNVSEITSSEYRAEYIAYFDNLLKLPNGAKLEQDIDVLASLETVALIYFEVKRFDDINELYGWDNGDGVLRQIRDWLLTSESRRAQLYRVNNGFAILGRQVTMEDARDRVEEIQKRFRKPWALSAGGNNIFIYFSIRIGIVYGKYIKNEMRNILMRTIRASEKNGYGFAVYDEEEDRKAKKALMVRDRFINCVFNEMKGFEVHYQPIVDVASRRWVAAEALCRWTTPGGERIPPVDFIRAAEQLNLIEHLDAWVCKTAMRDCIALNLDRLDFTLDVNYSPTQHLGDVFIPNLLRSLEEVRYPPGKLNVEITEGARMVFDQANIDGLMKLKKYGIGLSLDDFGTGYSSMENLIKISASAIKTDRVFLEGIHSDPYRQYLLRMLVDLAGYLGMLLVVEGVETEEEFALVRQYGVNRVQGYLFSRPLSFKQMQTEAWRFHHDR